MEQEMLHVQDVQQVLKEREQEKLHNQLDVVHVAKDIMLLEQEMLHVMHVQPVMLLKVQEIHHVHNVLEQYDIINVIAIVEHGMIIVDAVVMQIIMLIPSVLMDQNGEEAAGIVGFQINILHIIIVPMVDFIEIIIVILLVELMVTKELVKVLFLGQHMDSVIMEQDGIVWYTHNLIKPKMFFKSAIEALFFIE